MLIISYRLYILYIYYINIIIHTYNTYIFILYIVCRYVLSKQVAVQLNYIDAIIIVIRFVHVQYMLQYMICTLYIRRIVYNILQCIYILQYSICYVVLCICYNILVHFKLSYVILVYMLSVVYVVSRYMLYYSVYDLVLYIFTS